MSNSAFKKKKKIKPIAKPYLRGSVYGRTVLFRGMKLWVYPFIFILFNLFVGAPFSFENSPFLRVVMNGLLIVFCGLLLYSGGQNAGYGDISIAEIMYNHEQEGKPVSAKDRERCYHPLKGAVTALIGCAPWLLIALIYALTAKRQEFTLPVLPNWVGSYSAQASFSAPLQYYSISHPFEIADVLRYVVRLLIYPYINLVGARNADLVLLMDRLSPLTVCLPFTAYAIGYLRGRYSRAMLHGSMAAADRRKRRKARQAERKTKSRPELV